MGLCVGLCFSDGLQQHMSYCFMIWALEQACGARNIKCIWMTAYINHSSHSILHSLSRKINTCHPMWDGHFRFVNLSFIVLTFYAFCQVVWGPTVGLVPIYFPISWTVQWNGIQIQSLLYSTKWVEGLLCKGNFSQISSPSQTWTGISL